MLVYDFLNSLKSNFEQINPQKQIQEFYQTLLKRVNKKEALCHFSQLLITPDRGLSLEVMYFDGFCICDYVFSKELVTHTIAKMKDVSSIRLEIGTGNTNNTQNDSNQNPEDSTTITVSFDINGVDDSLFYAGNKSKMDDIISLYYTMLEVSDYGK